MAYVVWTKKAYEQLERVVKYIKAEQSSSYAEVVLNKILTSTRSLADFPQIGQTELFLSHKKSEYHYLLVWRYKIVYRVNGDKVTVSRVFHTSRDPKKIM